MAKEDMEARLAAIEKRLEKLEGSEKPKRAAAQKKLSAKEFLLTRNVKSEAQKVLTLAYFLETYADLISFNVTDLENVFRSAREKLPKNMNDAVNKNITRGFLMEAEQKKDSKKAWHLTSTGERYVKEQKS